ncbi:DUF2637 domain-containing protein [Nocardia sp. NPDC058497]|uniref:DUF2637 domain-containing protein n=1 Tax=Nocardia sp. NPDC058497 TaxID=3346529 RepID=UPI0036614ACB
MTPVSALLVPDDNDPERGHARIFFWCVLAVAAIVSIVGNGVQALLHSSILPAVATAVAVIPPLALLAAVHGVTVLARIDGGAVAARRSTTALTVVIAGAAFWMSFTALRGLAVTAGVPAAEAWLWPLIVEGSMTQSTIALLALAHHDRYRPSPATGEHHPAAGRWVERPVSEPLPASSPGSTSNRSGLRTPTEKTTTVSTPGLPSDEPAPTSLIVRTPNTTVRTPDATSAAVRTATDQTTTVRTPNGQSATVRTPGQPSGVRTPTSLTVRTSDATSAAVRTATELPDAVRAAAGNLVAAATARPGTNSGVRTPVVDTSPESTVSSATARSGPASEHAHPDLETLADRVCRRDPRGRRLAATVTEILIRHRVHGHNASRIARELGPSRSAVSRILRDADELDTPHAENNPPPSHRSPPSAPTDRPAGESEPPTSAPTTESGPP